MKTLRSLAGSVNLSSAIKRFTAGAALLSVSNLVSAGLGFLVSVTIARHFGASTTGLLASISSMVAILAIAGGCGTDVLVLREAARQKDQASFKRIVRHLRLISLIGVTVVMICLALLNYSNFITPIDALDRYTILLAFLAFALVLHRVNSGALRAAGDIVRYSLLGAIQAMLLLIASQVAIISNANTNLLVVCYFLPYAFMALYSTLALRNKMQSLTLPSPMEQDKPFRSQLQGSFESIKKLAWAGFPMMGTAFGYVVFTTADIIILSYFEPTSEVGIYSIYVRLVSVVIIASSSANAMLGPTLSKLYSSKKHDELRTFAKQATLITFIAVLLPSLVLIAFSNQILAIFGEEFTATPYALYILLIGYVLSAWFGSVGYFLNMADRAHVFMRISLTTAALNIVLNLLLIPTYGVEGAAIASMIAILWKAISAARYINREFGYTLAWR